MRIAMIMTWLHVNLLFTSMDSIKILNFMDTRIFVWDCQGAGHPQFHYFVSEYRKEFKPDILCFYETQISGSQADGVLFRIGFPNSFRVKENGFGKGIWILWMDILDFHLQVVYLRVCDGNGVASFFMLCCLCKSAIIFESALWFVLNLFAISIDDHGFECVRVRRMCMMVANGSSPFYSIIGYSRDNLYQRLYRVVCNSGWDSFAPNCVVLRPQTTLVSLCLDCIRGRQPFRLLANWLFHPKFKILVRENWSNDEGVSTTLKQFQGVIEIWNKRGFGNIFASKWKLMDKLIRVNNILELKFLERLQSVSCNYIMRLRRF
ncbi:hypothetical protein CXB51_005387 [Gossypium anomalum]|uniref:Uncharacterized protein n=1 Tax=Gossypium anomalum TaxID=47600 RepID=A0A8J5Z2J7_9ROSI|nr:hypothetical protein CXB51_005387 [Gossypium anomalum]